MARHKSISTDESTIITEATSLIHRPCKGFGYNNSVLSEPLVDDTVQRYVVERPARRIGVLLALQQVDGVDDSSAMLFKGQYDEAYGDFDPACDIHTDPLLFRDQLMRSGYSDVMSKSTPSVAEPTDN